MFKVLVTWLASFCLYGSALEGQKLFLPGRDPTMAGHNIMIKLIYGQCDLITRVDSNQPELIRIVICVRTLPIGIDKNQLAFIPTPLKSRIEGSW